MRIALTAEPLLSSVCIIIPRKNHSSQTAGTIANANATTTTGNVRNFSTCPLVNSTSASWRIAATSAPSNNAITPYHWSTNAANTGHINSPNKTAGNQNPPLGNPLAKPVLSVTLRATAINHGTQKNDRNVNDIINNANVVYCDSSALANLPNTPMAIRLIGNSKASPNSAAAIEK